MKTSISKDLQTASQIVNGGPEDFDENDQLIESVRSPVTQLYSSVWHQAILRHKISQYPETLEEDEEFERTSVFSALSRRARMAVKVRMEEKRILHQMLRYFSQVEQRLRQSAKPKPEDIHDEL